MVAEATDDVKQAYEELVKKSMEIATVKDLDFLYA